MGLTVQSEPLGVNRQVFVNRHHFHSFSSRNDNDSQDDPFNTPIHIFARNVPPSRSMAQNRPARFVLTGSQGHRWGAG